MMLPLNAFGAYTLYIIYPCYFLDQTYSSVSMNIALYKLLNIISWFY
jgi:hypothetical protein